MNATFGERGNVAVLARYRKTMKNPVLGDLMNHWESLRAGRIAPHRAEIDPRRIEDVLEHAFILEMVADGAPRFRIAGMQLCDLMGMEVRAMPAASLFAPSERDRFNDILQRIVAVPEIVELDLSPAGPAHVGSDAEMLLLPVRNDKGEITRILGALVADKTGMAPPCRFTIAATRTTRIIAHVFDSVAVPLAGFAEPAGAFRGAPSRDTRPTRSERPHLRLVKSGK